MTDFPLNDVRVAVTAMSRTVIDDNCIIGAYNQGGHYYLTYWSSAWSTGDGLNNIDHLASEVSCLEWHTFDLGLSRSGALTIDGAIKLTTTYNTAGMSSTRKLPFFARWSYYGSIERGRWLIKNVRILRMSTGVLHSFIPALDREGTPCMYALQDGKPFYNAGSGQFLYKLL